MDNSNTEKLTRDILADSRLVLGDPVFDERVMTRIMLEGKKIEFRHQLLMNILVFTGIELIVFTLILLLLNFQGIGYFENAISNSFEILEKGGNIVIQYGYLIVSLLLAWLLDILFGRKVRIAHPY